MTPKTHQTQSQSKQSAVMAKQQLFHGDRPSPEEIQSKFHKIVIYFAFVAGRRKIALMGVGGGLYRLDRSPPGPAAPRPKSGAGRS